MFWLPGSTILSVSTSISSSTSGVLPIILFLSSKQDLPLHCDGWQHCRLFLIFSVACVCCFVAYQHRAFSIIMKLILAISVKHEEFPCRWAGTDILRGLPGEVCCQAMKSMTISTKYVYSTSFGVIWHRAPTGCPSLVLLNTRSADVLASMMMSSVVLSCPCRFFTPVAFDWCLASLILSLWPYCPFVSTLLLSGPGSVSVLRFGQYIFFRLQWRNSLPIL